MGNAAFSLSKGLGLATGIIAATVALSFIPGRSVNIIAVHQNPYTAAVIVERLPWRDRDKIAWWRDNEKRLIKHYSLKIDNPRGALDYFVYAFGEGYQPEGDADRLCFEEIKSPSRCIDKNLLMVVTQNRAGEQIFLIDQYRYQVMRDGELQKQPLIKPGDIR
ncbi:DUF943 family protein [Cronobacter turicensis]|uniref:DUF943 family protein n=1 Tax=Cronobacter turicensis TaxID=413502 RepID=UPI002937CAE8|nr:DUF943 family protein [Cronobacter turicensis]ELQ6269362.1 DUF943 family protein [Cronobacter turicensis]ELQ6273172.1 DUF943 family protein [Cronobacter turicensis]ELQ6273188.1 DUF943 family protein [Cronobacter turicensis]ELQ6273204.1 DUF943 family protein [Cronobacter turicensis]